MCHISCVTEMPKSSKKNKTRKGNSNSVVSHFPGQYKVRPVQRMQIRYSNASTATNQACTVQEIVTLLVATASETTSAQATPLFASVRVACIEIWSIGSTAQNLVSGLIKLIWTGDSNREDCEITAYGDPNVPAHIRSYPPKYSLSANWQSVRDGSEDTNQLFRYSAAQNSIVALHIEYVLADAAELATEAGTEITLSSAQVSGVYARLIATDTLTPQGWSQVTVASIPRAIQNKDDFDVESVSAFDDTTAQLLAVNKRLNQELMLLKAKK